jgi:hypothetical protein
MFYQAQVFTDVYNSSRLKMITPLSQTAEPNKNVLSKLDILTEEQALEKAVSRVKALTKCLHALQGSADSNRTTRQVYKHLLSNLKRRVMIGDMSESLARFKINFSEINDKKIIDMTTIRQSFWNESQLKYQQTLTRIKTCTTDENPQIRTPEKKDTGNFFDYQTFGEEEILGGSQCWEKLARENSLVSDHGDYNRSRCSVWKNLPLIGGAEKKNDGGDTEETVMKTSKDSPKCLEVDADEENGFRPSENYMVR